MKVVKEGTERDEVFRDEKDRVGDFQFNREVVKVFDDMVGRSVPFYAEIQRMITEMSADFATPGSNVYDLGCSTGTTFLDLHPRVDPSVRFVGVDNSEEMLKKCRQKLTEAGVDRPLELQCTDLNSGVPVRNASIVMLILTLQFVRPNAKMRTYARDRINAMIHRIMVAS